MIIQQIAIVAIIIFIILLVGYCSYGVFDVCRMTTMLRYERLLLDVISPLNVEGKNTLLICDNRLDWGGRFNTIKMWLTGYIISKTRMRVILVETSKTSRTIRVEVRVWGGGRWMPYQSIESATAVVWDGYSEAARSLSELNKQLNNAVGVLWGKIDTGEIDITSEVLSIDPTIKYGEKR